ncbi:MAG: hypothetical protein AAFU41_00725 [Pseudomonadota bacterium]
MSVFAKELAERAAQAKEQARVYALGIEILLEAQERLIQAGFKPVIYEDEADFLQLRFDPDNVRGDEPAMEAEEKPAVLPDPPPPFPPRPVPVDTSCDKPQPWSSEEDATMVRIMAEGGTAKDVADATGRPVPGIKYRAYHKLKTRIAEAKAARAAGKVQDKPNHSPISATSIRAQQQKIENDTTRLDEPFNSVERGIEHRIGMFDASEIFTPQMDLQIAEALLKGEGAVGAAELHPDLSAGDVRDRWLKINQYPGDLDHQKALLKVLRRRAEAA